MWENQRTEANDSEEGEGRKREETHESKRERERSDVRDSNRDQCGSQSKPLNLTRSKNITREILKKKKKLKKKGRNVALIMCCLISPHVILCLHLSPSSGILRDPPAALVGPKQSARQHRCDRHIQLFAPRLTAVTSRLFTQTSLSPVWIGSHTMRSTSDIFTSESPGVSGCFTAHFVARLQQKQLLGPEGRVFWDRGEMERENLAQNEDIQFRKSLAFYSSMSNERNTFLFFFTSLSRKEPFRFEKEILFYCENSIPNCSSYSFLLVTSCFVKIESWLVTITFDYGWQSEHTTILDNSAASRLKKNNNLLHELGQVRDKILI